MLVGQGGRRLDLNVWDCQSSLRWGLHLLIEYKCKIELERDLGEFREKKLHKKHKSERRDVKIKEKSIWERRTIGRENA